MLEPNDPITSAPPEYSFAPLSPREFHTLYLIAWGYTNTQIAGQLTLSVKTVEAHKANGMRKLKLRNRYGVVRYAVERGWLVLNENTPMPPITAE